ncbi:Transcriptional regulator [Hahella chejuensis KCTC 2396]|uniref:Transcriptional regulator n=1 Tax=Hahella chejuensis (strain KCTC 2396) TaxID=349521 RepID=Q2SNH6_HAHCH|nr:LysR family transcriptional regulator [Hahella chejuensis]ABC27798.1 Transcriptional regulator [Hahella chejuensis KCTC 2396]
MNLSHHIIAHLPFLAAVYRARSFTRAAEEMHVSQAAVSYQIRQLEQKIGVCLVVRQSGSRIHLTHAGQNLVDEYLISEQRLQATLDSLAGESLSGRLKITAPIDFGSLVMPAAIAELEHLAPALQIELHVSDDLIDLIAQQFDVAIRSPATGAALTHHLLTTSKKQVVAGKEYLQRRGLPETLADLKHHRLLTRANGKAASWGQLFRQNDLSLDAMPERMRLGNTFALAEGVRNNLGVAILPSFAVGKDIAEGKVIELFPSFSAPLLTEFYLSYPPSAPIRKRLAALAQAIRTVMVSERFSDGFIEADGLLSD